MGPDQELDDELDPDLEEVQPTAWEHYGLDDADADRAADAWERGRDRVAERAR